MRNFVSALSFLTIVPTGRWAGKLQGDAVLYFPVIGILIGGLLAGVDWLGSLFYLTRFAPWSMSLFWR